jgi:hypothetical protein
MFEAAVLFKGNVEDQDEDFNLSSLFTLPTVHLIPHVSISRFVLVKRLINSVPFQPLSLSLLHLVISDVSLCEHHATFSAYSVGAALRIFAAANILLVAVRHNFPPTAAPTFSRSHNSNKMFFPDNTIPSPPPTATASSTAAAAFPTNTQSLQQLQPQHALPQQQL